MKRHSIFFISFLFLFFYLQSGFAENYVIKGEQNSQIRYLMSQNIELSYDIGKFFLSCVVPESFDSPTYSQKITDFDIYFSPEPASREEKIDQRGNKIVYSTWKSPSPESVNVKISFIANNNVKLNRIQSNNSSFPIENVPEQVKVYLSESDQVPANDRRIIAKARELTGSAKTQFDAVQMILTWVIDHMRYVLIPESYDAMYSFESGRGNCQNYSHLSAALMRAVGIPVRIVNGISLKRPYEVRLENAIQTLKMAEGRHSWIEVYFPSLGWLPFEPQGSELFVSNRYIRIEVGLDNNETRQDGLIRWFQINRSAQKPRLEERINGEFLSDNVSFTAAKMNYGPRAAMLFCPDVGRALSHDIFKTVVPFQFDQDIPKYDAKLLSYKKPYYFGNLEFPENVDFLSTRGPAQLGEGGAMEMRKNFLVETAEYVTTKGYQYAQAFILRKPLLLKKAGLAIRKFSNDGQLWVELFKDNKSIPGSLISTSEIVPVSQMPSEKGYSWVNFDFNKSTVILSPGYYWIALGFTEAPIINWFFTYGKPSGPRDGTRYKYMFDETWGRSLPYEFNYRIDGLASK